MIRTKKPKRGNCYKSACRALLDGDHPLSPETELVHGYPTGTGGEPEGRRYGHAWLEYGPMVFDTEHKLLVPQALYYVAGSIDGEECIRYSKREAMMMLARHDHWGPWHKEPAGVL